MSLTSKKFSERQAALTNGAQARASAADDRRKRAEEVERVAAAKDAEAARLDADAAAKTHAKLSAEIADELDAAGDKFVATWPTARRDAVRTARAAITRASERCVDELGAEVAALRVLAALFVRDDRIAAFRAANGGQPHGVCWTIVQQVLSGAGDAELELALLGLEATIEKEMRSPHTVTDAEIAKAIRARVVTRDIVAAMTAIDERRLRERHADARANREAVPNSMTVPGSTRGQRAANARIVADRTAAPPQDDAPLPAVTAARLDAVDDDDAPRAFDAPKLTLPPWITRQ